MVYRIDFNDELIRALDVRAGRLGEHAAAAGDTGFTLGRLTMAYIGMRRDFPPSGNGDDAPRLVVFEVINLKPLKGEVSWSRLHESKCPSQPAIKPVASVSIWPSA